MAGSGIVARYPVIGLEMAREHIHVVLSRREPEHELDGAPAPRTHDRRNVGRVDPDLVVAVPVDVGDVLQGRPRPSRASRPRGPLRSGVPPRRPRARATRRREGTADRCRRTRRASTRRCSGRGRWPAGLRGDRRARGTGWRVDWHERACAPTRDSVQGTLATGRPGSTGSPPRPAAGCRHPAGFRAPPARAPPARASPARARPPGAGSRPPSRGRSPERDRRAHPTRDGRRLPS